jgi:hypothetical protein
MQLSENYISLPRRLLVELRDTPLALALYFFIARLALIQQQPIPLSRGDIRAFDPAAKPGAVKRALDRLVEAHWLIETARVGHKSTYWPVWGQSRQGVAYGWNVSAERLGCPMYIWCDAVRVDRALLDLFMGKFLPHPRNAHIERYVSGPLLRLTDIGTYILLAAELPAEATEELVRWGLVQGSQVQLVPEDTVVLALASQQAATGGSELTAAGWRKLGWFEDRSRRRAEVEQAEAVPLFFVPKERIGCRIGALIGQLIGGTAASDGENGASGSGKTAGTRGGAIMRGIGRDSQDSRETTPNPLHRAEQSGGGFISLGQKKSAGQPTIEGANGPGQDEPGAGGEQAARARQNGPERQNKPALPDTEAVRLLWAAGARNPERLAALSATPPERVEEVVAAARARTQVADKAGWAIAALSEGWDIALPPGEEDRDTPLKAADYIGGAYGDLFRLGSDISDFVLPSHTEHVRADDQAQEAASGYGQPSDNVAAQPPPPDLGQPQPLVGIPGLSPQPTARCSAIDLTKELRSRLRVQCGRSYRRVIDGLAVQVAGDTTVIYCASLDDRLAVLDALMGALRWIVADLGLPTTIRVTERPPDGLEAPGGGGQSANGVLLSA